MSQVRNEGVGTLGVLLPYKVSKTLTFAGGTPNAVGDHDGTGDPADLFTVTGDVVIQLLAICTTSLTFDANAAIEVGIGGGNQIIATTDLTVEALTAREIWHDASPDSEVEPLSVLREYIVVDGNDVQLDTTVANVTAGVIEFTCFWFPISDDGRVIAA